MMDRRGQMTPESGNTNADPMVEPVVRVQNLVKRFRRADGTELQALNGVSFEIQPSEFVVLLGPSGCGKTTLLRSVAGLEQPDEGAIEVLGRTVYSAEEGVFVPPERRRLSMIFQSYALWPHMTAYANIAYPLQCRKVPKKEIAERVNQVLGLVGIPNLGKQHPGALSGGQQQRVALARALVANDRLVLFDEPLSNVDAKVREQLRMELLTMQADLRFAALYVTHDQIEAMELADRIAVMNSGRIAQLGSPSDVYDRPTNPYVARFIGTVNEVRGTVVDVKHDGARVETELGEMIGEASHGIGIGDQVVVMVRPELLEMSATESRASSDSNSWRGTVKTAVYVGSHTEYIVDVGGMSFRVWRALRRLEAEHAEVWLSISRTDTLVLRDE